MLAGLRFPPRWAGSHVWAQQGQVWKLGWLGWGLQHREWCWAAAGGSPLPAVLPARAAGGAVFCLRCENWNSSCWMWLEYSFRDRDVSAGVFARLLPVSFCKGVVPQKYSVAIGELQWKHFLGKSNVSSCSILEAEPGECGALPGCFWAGAGAGQLRDSTSKGSKGMFANRAG